MRLAIEGESHKPLVGSSILPAATIFELDSVMNGEGAALVKVCAGTQEAARESEQSPHRRFHTLSRAASRTGKARFAHPPCSYEPQLVRQRFALMPFV